MTPAPPPQSPGPPGWKAGSGGLEATTRLTWTNCWRLSRPGFLSITAAAVVLGWSTAWACGCGFNPWVAGVTLLLALMVHAGANALNDHADALNGADAANDQGVYPFTGGSRVIQQGQATARQAASWAWMLLALAALGGLWLALYAGGVALLGVGLAGLFLAWAYSMPPLSLMSRGWGELTVGLAWALVVVGADVAQRGQWLVIPMYVSLGVGMLVANILLINGVPDAEADRRVGKRTLATRLSGHGVVGLYGALGLGAHLWLALGVWALVPPVTALWGLVSLPGWVAAWWQLAKHHHQPQRLRPAMVLTIAAAHIHTLGLALGMVLARSGSG